jgi:hypothetical protein
MTDETEQQEEQQPHEQLPHRFNFLVEARGIWVPVVHKRAQEPTAEELQRVQKEMRLASHAWNLAETYDTKPQATNNNAQELDLAVTARNWLKQHPDMLYVRYLKMAELVNFYRSKVPTSPESPPLSAGDSGVEVSIPDEVKRHPFTMTERLKGASSTKARAAEWQDIVKRSHAKTIGKTEYDAAVFLTKAIRDENEDRLRISQLSPLVFVPGSDKNNWRVQHETRYRRMRDFVRKLDAEAGIKRPE